MSPEAILLAEQNGGLWHEHDDYPLAQWQAAVSSDDTRLGYWDWVLTNIEMQTGISPVKPLFDQIEDPMGDEEKSANSGGVFIRDEF